MKCILVLGPASSGTRMTARILIANGGVGQDGHVQDHDKKMVTGNPAIWRRSVPHANWWLDLEELLVRLRSYDDVRAVVTTRDHLCMAHSQVRNGHSKDLEHAHKNIARANSLIIPQLVDHGIRFHLSSYESMVLHPEEAQRALLDELDMPFKETLKEGIRNMNSPHWEALGYAHAVV